MLHLVYTSNTYCIAIQKIKGKKLVFEMKMECVYCEVGTEKLKMYLKEAQEVLSGWSMGIFRVTCQTPLNISSISIYIMQITRKFVFCSQNLFMCFG